MRRQLVALILLFFAIQAVQALTINIQGDRIVGHKLTITTDKPALIILRMNDGTPIYANTTTYFTPHVSGTLKIEAISGNERAVSVLKIKQSSTTPPSGGGGLVGDYYLPSGTTTITLEDGSKATIGWRTALGILIKASQEKDFGVKVKRWSYGLYVSCIGGICEKSLGTTSGWMYQVNGEVPMVSSDQYDLNAGDTVVWFFSRNMSETPETSPYKITLKTYSDWSFDVSIAPSMPWVTTSGGGGGETTPTPTPEIKPKVNVTEKVVEIALNGTATVEVNVTKIPLNLTISTTKPVSLKVESEEPSGMIFNNIHSYILDCFGIESNESFNLTIAFAIPKEKLIELNSSPKDVFLAHYNGSWTFIPTKYSENETHYIFTANISNFSLFAILVKWRDFPLNASDERIVRALNWLKDQQRSDGGWGSLANTSWVVMAIASAGGNPLNWTKNGKDPLDYFKANLNESAIDRMGTSDFARTILALIALNQNPYDFNGINFVAKLKERMKPDGQIGDYIYTTIWGIIALKACGENVSKSVEWLKAHQNSDGGFAWAVGEKSDFDDTASAIQALIAGGVSRDDPVIVKALEYLKKGQCEDGGMRYFGNSSSNADSDAWTIQALVSACVNPMDWKKNGISVVDHLLSLQSDEGYFKYTKFVTSIPIKVTADSIMALLGKPHPVVVKSFNVTPTPTSTPTSTPTPTPTPIGQTSPAPTAIPTVQTSGTPTTKPGFRIYGFKAIAGSIGIAIALAVRRWRGRS